MRRSFTAQCTDEFLHGPYKNQLVLDLNTKCGSELLYVRCELAKFATTIIFVIFLLSNFCEQKKQNYFPRHIIYYFIMRHIKETSSLSQHYSFIRNLCKRIKDCREIILISKCRELCFLKHDHIV